MIYPEGKKAGAARSGSRQAEGKRAHRSPAASQGFAAPASFVLKTHTGIFNIIHISFSPAL